MEEKSKGVAINSCCQRLQKAGKEKRNIGHILPAIDSKQIIKLIVKIGFLLY
jgi:hypothetical protein